MVFNKYKRAEGDELKKQPEGSGGKLPATNCGYRGRKGGRAGPPGATGRRGSRPYQQHWQGPQTASISVQEMHVGGRGSQNEDRKQFPQAQVTGRHQPRGFHRGDYKLHFG